MKLEEKCFSVNKTSLDLLQSLRHAEMEVKTLKGYVLDLKARVTIYIPVKDCDIDRKLAEHINNYPDRAKLKVMFARESKGVYEFGSTRVHINLNREKLQVKVGGGYLSVDEFLDQYTPAELSKMERRDPFKRNNYEKLVSAKSHKVLVPQQMHNL